MSPSERSRSGGQCPAGPSPQPWVAALPAAAPARAVSTGPGSLASNESILPPCPAAVAAMTGAVHRAHRYPDGTASELRAAIAEELEADPDAIVIGNGSEEIFRLLLEAYAGHGGRVALADPACTVHERACQLVGAGVVRRRLSAWTHDLAALAACRADVALICNPHNPAGTVVGRPDIAEFAGRCQAGLTIVDEAYIDFADDPERLSCAALALARSDLAVVRTLSKIHGLAGARLGYLVASPDIAMTARKLQASFPVNAVAQAGGVAAVQDREYRHRLRSLTRELRGCVTDMFGRAGYEVVPSQANFVLVIAPDEDELIQKLAAGGIRVRSGRSLGVPGTLRVSVPSGDGLRMIADTLGVPVQPGR